MAIKEVEQTIMPERIARRPRDERGYPVPYFVAYVDGKPDLKLLDQHKQIECVRNRRCGICGEQIDDALIAFVTGPVGVKNRVCTDPPMHEACAEYAVKVCPFMARPTARRAATHHPDSITGPGALEDRPDRTAIYLARHYIPFWADDQSLLIRFYPAHHIRWFRDGVELELDPGETLE